MRIGFDPAKRARVLAERGIDFADAGQVFAGRYATVPDRRRDYGEERSSRLAIFAIAWLSSCGRSAA